MSNHQWPARLPDGREVVIRAGWDQPLQYFFLTILDEQTDDDDQCRVFSNLDFENGPGMTLEQITGVLDRLRLLRPAQIDQLLEADRKSGSMASYHYAAEQLEPCPAVAPENPLAQVGYEGYGAHTGFRTWNDLPMPAWADLGPNVHGAWGAAGRAILLEVFLNTTPFLMDITRRASAMVSLAEDGNQQALLGQARELSNQVARLSDMLNPKDR
jgi:hypothetical protein